jgi:hypothetical protein
MKLEQPSKYGMSCLLGTVRSVFKGPRKGGRVRLTQCMRGFLRSSSHQPSPSIQLLTVQSLFGTGSDSAVLLNEESHLGNDEGLSATSTSPKSHNKRLVQQPCRRLVEPF